MRERTPKNVVVFSYGASFTVRRKLPVSYAEYNKRLLEPIGVIDQTQR